MASKQKQKTCTSRRHAARLAAFFALALTLSAPGPLTAQEQQQQPASSPPPPGTARSITLHDLGLDRGIDFSSFSGYRDLYFPIPHHGFQTATLEIFMRAGAAFPGRRNLQISAGGRVLDSRPLGLGESLDPVIVPIDPALAEDGFLRVTLRYSGALQADRCVDERVSGDFLSIRPETALNLNVAPESLADVRSVASLMPRDVVVVLPERTLERGEIAAALRASAVLKHKGAIVTLGTPTAVQQNPAGPWSRGVILIGKPQDYPFLPVNAQAGDGIIVVPTASGPALLIGGGEDAATALPLLNTRWLPLADAGALAVNLLAEDGKLRRSISFEELGVPLQTTELDERTQFDVPFASDQLPRATSLDAVKVELAVGPGPQEISIFAFINGRLLGGRQAHGGVPITLSLPVPEGLIGRDNTLTVRLQRPPRDGACVRPAPGQPVQLLPSSAMELAGMGGEPKEFFQLPQSMRGGVDVVLPNEPAKLREAIAFLIATGIDLLPDDAPIFVRLEPKPTIGDRAFIVVSRIEPADTDPRLRFDRGTLAITRSDGRLLVDLSHGETMPTVAQVVRTARGDGLWLRPGKVLPDPNEKPVRLDRGDIAVIDKAGIALAFSPDKKQAATITYHEIRTWWDVANEWRPWIVAGIWLAVAAAFAIALSRAYRRRGAR